MKNTRYELAKYDLTEPEAITAHLEQQAAQGWQLCNIGVYLWRYDRCAPQKLTYAVVYSPERIAACDAVPTERQTEYRAYCEEAGWRWVAAIDQLQIFCTDRADLPPLETDEVVKLETIRRSIRAMYLPMQLILLGIWSIVLVTLAVSTSRDPLSLFSENFRLFQPLFFLLLWLDALLSLLRHVRWYHRSRRAVAAGGRCVQLTGRFRQLRHLLLWTALALFVVGAAMDGFMGNTRQFLGHIHVVLRASVLFSAVGLRSLLTRWKWDRIKIFLAVAGAVLLLELFLVWAEPTRAFLPETEAQALPLSSQDLGWPPYAYQDYAGLEHTRTPLLDRLFAQHLNDPYSIAYTRYLPAACIYDLVRQQLLQERDWVPAPADAVWNGAEAWQASDRAGSVRYLLCGPECLLELYYETPPTVEQIGISLAALLPA